MQSSNLQNKNIQPITALDAKKLAQVSSTFRSHLEVYPMPQEDNSTNDSWVLGLVGVGASLLAAGGQFSIMYSLMGLILLAVVTTVDNIHCHSFKFIRAYACVLAMCLVLVFASPINAILVSFGIAGRSPVDIGTHGENYPVEITHIVLAVLWMIIAVYIYLKHRGKKLRNGET